MADRKRIVLTDEIMNDYLDTANTKSLNEMMFKAYEGEIMDIKKSNPKLKDASPIKLAMLDAGITGSSIIKDFTAQNVGSWLLPAFIDERLNEEIPTFSLMPYLCTNVTPANSLSVLATKLNMIDDEENKSNVEMKRVQEGADFPIAELKLAEIAIKLFKYGRAVRATYEALQYMRVDMFSHTMDMIANDIADKQSDRAINVLVNGDGNDNKIKTISTATADTVTVDDLLELAMQFQDNSGVPVTTLVTNRDFYKQIYKMMFSTDDVRGVTNGFTFNTPQFNNVNVNLVWSSKVPKISNKNAVIALNNNVTLTKYVANNMNMREIQQNIRNQTQLGVISEISGFAKYNDRAALALISK